MRDDARGKFVLLVVDSHAISGGPPSEFVLLIQDVESSPAISEDALRALYGLTRREGHVAARLIGGASVAAIAAEVGVSANTVRTHLKRIFGKTGASSQSALMRIVLSGLPALHLGNGRHGGGKFGSVANRFRRGQAVPR
ncbi:MAG: helix-turn-helix transcriptional regulator [Deltaproteobacteria bacterium]|nr:helix-turn-helix transcriptional regulator [Deltaproteobacteria bacterium]